MSEYGKKRRRIAAEQVRNALKSKGVSKKQLAEIMCKSPSEVTRWVSGDHNFTIDVLEEISEALGVTISGVSTCVHGYGPFSPVERTLNDPHGESISVGDIQLSADVHSILMEKAMEQGVTLEEYAALVLTRDASC